MVIVSYIFDEILWHLKNFVSKHRNLLLFCVILLFSSGQPCPCHFILFCE